MSSVIILIIFLIYSLVLNFQVVADGCWDKEILQGLLPMHIVRERGRGNKPPPYILDTSLKLGIWDIVFQKPLTTKLVHNVAPHSVMYCEEFLSKYFCTQNFVLIIRIVNIINYYIKIKI